MNRKEKVNGIEVIARPSREGDRLYFTTGGRGCGCFDLIHQEWIKQKGEFGGRFKVAIEAAFGLRGAK